MTVHDSVSPAAQEKVVDPPPGRVTLPTGSTTTPIEPLSSWPIQVSVPVPRNRDGDSSRAVESVETSSE
jgi:hypothetical protein